MVACVVTFSSELYRTQCMNVNKRNYRRFESRKKVNQLMYGMGEDESVGGATCSTECEKYERDRMGMMQVILTE